MDHPYICLAGPSSFAIMPLSQIAPEYTEALKEMLNTRMKYNGLLTRVDDNTPVRVFTLPIVPEDTIYAMAWREVVNVLADWGITMSEPESVQVDNEIFEVRIAEMMGIPSDDDAHLCGHKHDFSQADIAKAIRSACVVAVGTMQQCYGDAGKADGATHND